MEDNNIRERELFIDIERLLVAMEKCLTCITSFKDALTKDKNTKNQEIYKNVIATCEWWLNLQNNKLKEAFDAYRNL